MVGLEGLKPIGMKVFAVLSYFIADETLGYLLRVMGDFGDFGEFQATEGQDSGINENEQEAQTFTEFGSSTVVDIPDAGVEINDRCGCGRLPQQVLLLGGVLLLVGQEPPAPLQLGPRRGHRLDIHAAQERLGLGALGRHAQDQNFPPQIKR